MMIAVKAHAAATDPGRERGENQDAFFADPAAGLYLVADGMGGMAAGGAASAAVVGILPKMLSDKFLTLPKQTERAVKEALIDAISGFSADLRNRASQTPQLKGMGSTLVLLLARRDYALLAHVGDSRIYLLERDRLKCLSKDHSIVAVMLELGKITAEQAKVHPFRHKISRYIGMDGKAVADVSTLRIKRAGRLLLCTDGLTNMLPERSIGAALRDEAAPEAACRRLLADANAAGGKDNITALVVDLETAAVRP